MENKLMVPHIEEYGGTTKKQHQEYITDLDAACYYSNIPLSELCSPEQIFSLKGIPAILPAYGPTAAIPRVIDNEIVSIDDNEIITIDTFTKTSLQSDKKVSGDYDGNIKKIKVTGVLSNETRDILRDKRKSRNRISKISKRKNRS